LRADRTAFDLEERIAGDTLDGDLSLDSIRSPLETARDEGKKRVNEYVSNRAPRYRPVLSSVKHWV
jgi:hypothetical protein